MLWNPYLPLAWFPLHSIHTSKTSPPRVDTCSCHILIPVAVIYWFQQKSCTNLAMGIGVIFFNIQNVHLWMQYVLPIHPPCKLNKNQWCLHNYKYHQSHCLHSSHAIDGRKTPQRRGWGRLYWGLFTSSAQRGKLSPCLHLKIFTLSV